MQQIHDLVFPAACRAAVEGKPKGISFKNYKEMFQKMEETFKFCTSCRKLPHNLSGTDTLKRCVR